MARPRDCHTKQSKAEKERQTPYDITYVESKIYKLTYLQKKKTDSQRTDLWLPEVEGQRERKLDGGGLKVETSKYKINNYQGHNVQQSYCS